MDVIKICMISDNEYAIPTGVAISSIVANKNPESNLLIYILSNGLDKFHQNKLLQMSSDSVEIKILEIDIQKYSQIQQQTHVRSAALVKFDLASVLDEDKVLYLDGDIIVKKDLSELFNQDLENHYAFAVRDMGGEITQEFNKKIGLNKYFNSGIMLFNLKKIREENLAQKFLEVKLSHPEWKCMDQDTLNFVFNENVKYIDMKYNAMIPLFFTYKFDLESVNKFYNKDYTSFFEMQDDAVIIHFAGESRLRPWKVVNGTMSESWMKYYYLSSYQNIDLNRGVFVSDINQVKCLPKELDAIKSALGKIIE